MAVGPKRSRIVAIAKLLLGLGLIALLLSTVDVGSMIQQFYAIDIRYVIFVFLLPHVGILLSTLKWQILLKALNIRVELRRLFGLYMIGTFFSNFLPTMVGGDAVRSYALYRDSGDAPSVLAATFLERLVGLTALLSLLPLILLQPVVHARFPMIDWIVGAILVSYLFVLALIFSPVFKLLNGWRPRIKILERVLDFIERTHANVRSFSACKQELMISFVISLLFYFVTVATTWFAAVSFGIEISYSFLLAVVPLVLLAAFVPISLNGLGITEAGYVIFFQLFGVSAENALGIALLLRLRLLVTASIGGLIFTRMRPRKLAERDSEKCVSG